MNLWPFGANAVRFGGIADGWRGVGAWSSIKAAEGFLSQLLGGEGQGFLPQEGKQQKIWIGNVKEECGSQSLLQSLPKAAECSETEQPLEMAAWSRQRRLLALLGVKGGSCFSVNSWLFGSESCSSEPVSSAGAAQGCRGTVAVSKEQNKGRAGAFGEHLRALWVL